MEKYMKNDMNKELIQRYADGELSTDEAKKAEALIKDSLEAKKEYDDIKTIGNAFRAAMKDETDQVDFRGAWAYINESIEKSERSGWAGIMNYFFYAITPKRAVAALAGIVFLIAGIIVVWELTLAPSTVVAAPAAIESIQYGDNSDIVVAVDVLENPATTVVWIEGIEINTNNIPPDEI